MDTARKSADRGFRIYGRGLLGSMLLLALMTLLVSVVVLAGVMMLSELAYAQLDTLIGADGINVRGVALLALQVGLPAGLLIIAVTTAGYCAVTTLLADVAEGRRPDFGSALTRGVSRVPAAVAVIAIAVFTVILALFATPFLILSGVLLAPYRLVTTLLSRRWPDLRRRPTWRTILLLVIPLAPALVLAARFGLALPVVALERRGVLASLRRSNALTTGKEVTVVLVVLLGGLLYLLSQVVIESSTYLGVARSTVSWAMIGSQLLVASLPVAMVTALFFVLAGGVDAGYAVPRPRMRRSGSTIVTASIVVVVLGVTTVLGTPTSARAAQQPATETSQSTEQPPAENPPAENPPGENPPGEGGEGGEGGGSHSGGALVDSLGDEPDANPGDDICATASGECTLRAALQEVAFFGGVGSVRMASTQIASGTVKLTAPLLLSARVAVSGSFYDEDSQGFTAARLTIDGGNLHQIFIAETGTQQEGSGSFSLERMVLANGYAGDNHPGGGALLVKAGHVGLTEMTFTGNKAVHGGSTIHLLSVTDSEIRRSAYVRNGKFIDNTVPSCYGDKGYAGLDIGTTQGDTSSIDVDDDSCGQITRAGSTVTSSTKLTANPATPVKGAAVTYTATVSASLKGSAPLAGTVDFLSLDGDTIAKDVPLTLQQNGTATAEAPSTVPGLGRYTVRAVYSGSETYRSSADDLVITTAGTKTSLTLTTEPESPGRGGPVRYVATVDAPAAGSTPPTIGGTVTFHVGGTQIGEAAITDGVATLDATVPPNDQIHLLNQSAAYYGVTAKYSGDDEYQASEKTAQVYLRPDHTEITLTASPAGAKPGEEVTFTARVASTEVAGAVVDRGKVRLTIGAGFNTSTRDAVVNTAGEAVFKINNLEFGTHPIEATYVANTLFGGSSASIDYAVTGMLDTQLTLSGPHGGTTAPGDVAAFGVKVAPVSGSPVGSPTPTGTVQLFADTLLLDSTTLNSGSAALTTKGLAVGQHTLRVVYGGDGQYARSEGTLTHKVVKLTTKTTILAEEKSTVTGQSISLTVGVAQGLHRVTDGAVTVYGIVGGGVPVAVVDGQVTMTVIPTGGTLRAVYSGTERLDESGAEYEHFVGKASVQVRLSAPTSPVPLQASLSADVAVTALAPGSGTPEIGTVTLYSGTTSLGTQQVDTKGATTFTLRGYDLQGGTHTLRAEYSGNYAYGAGTSGPVSVVITRVTPTLSLAVEPSSPGPASGSSAAGQPVQLTATVGIPWSPSMTGAGTVTFYRNGDVIGSATTFDGLGRATLTVPGKDLPVGAQTFSASYRPSAGFATRVTTTESANVGHTVVLVPTTMAMSGADAGAPAGERFLRTVRVQQDPRWSTGSQPEGTVHVTLGDIDLGSFPLTRPAGVAYSQVDVPFGPLRSGVHKATLRYEPVGTDAGTSIAVDLKVIGTVPILTLASQSSPTVWGELNWVEAKLLVDLAGAPAPVGTIEVVESGGAGARCLTDRDGRCGLRWDTPGIHTVVATFTPADTEKRYEKVSSGPMNIEVLRKPTTLVGTFSTTTGQYWDKSSPTVGDTVTARWQASGPRTGKVDFNIHPLAAVPDSDLGRCGTALSDTCSFTIGKRASELPTVGVSVRFAGDQHYLPADWSGSVTPRGCIPLRLDVTPEKAGTLVANQRPNCGGGTGYAIGTLVSFTATPAPSGDPGFTWDNQEVTFAGAVKGGSPFLRVGPGNDWARASFTKTYQCTRVQVEFTSLPGAEGQIALPKQKPNCPIDSAGAPAENPGWSTTRTSDGGAKVSSHARFLDGTALQFTLNKGREDTRLYRYSGDVWQATDFGTTASGAVGVSAEAVAANAKLQTIKATFGPTCYPVKTVANGPGTVQILNPENCSDPTGSGDGWFANTSLDLLASPASDPALSYLDSWQGVDNATGLEPGRGLLRHRGSFQPGSQPEGTQENTLLVTAGQDRDRTVTVDFTGCRTLTVGRGITYNDSEGGRVEVGIPRNCPVGDPRLPTYKPGTEVTLKAIAEPDFDGRFPDAPKQPYAFSGWQYEDKIVQTNPLTLTMDADRSLRPIFHYARDCAPVIAYAEDPKLLGVSFAEITTKRICPAGTLFDGPASRISGYMSKAYQTGQYQPDELGPDGKFRKGALQDENAGEMTLTAKQRGTNAMVGWDVSFKMRDTSGKLIMPDGGWTPTNSNFRTFTDASFGEELVVPMQFQSFTAKAVACQRVEPFTSLILEDGSVRTEPANDEDDLLMVYPAPDCPYAANAWRVGTTVELWAFGDPRGYTFKGWGRAAKGKTVTAADLETSAENIGMSDILDKDFPKDMLAKVTLDGQSPAIQVEASYSVNCAQVSVTRFTSEVDWYPESNCPGFEGADLDVRWDAKELKATAGGLGMTPEQFNKRFGPKIKRARFIKGTDLMMRTKSVDGHVWQGWQGTDLEKPRTNPATIFIDRDLDIVNKYREKSTGEKFVDTFENDIPIFFKKAAGVIAVGLTEYLKYYPPLGIVTTMAEGLALVGSLLELAGVDPDDVKYLKYAKEMIDLPFSVLSCAGEWGLGSSKTGAASAVGLTAANVAKYNTYRVQNIVDAQKSLAATRAQAQLTGGSGAWMKFKLAGYKGKLGLAKFSYKAAPVAGVGVAIAAVSAGMDMKWDANASDAWTDGSAYTDCLKRKIPSFVHQAVAAGKKG